MVKKKKPVRVLEHHYKGAINKEVPHSSLEMISSTKGGELDKKCDVANIHSGLSVCFTGCKTVRFGLK